MISWICDLHAPSGYGRASRADLRSIIKSGIIPSVVLHQHDKTQMPLGADPFWSQYERKVKQLPTDSPDIIVWQETPEFYRPDPTAACVARVEWETSKIIDHNIHGRQDFNWVAQLNRMTEIWPACVLPGEPILTERGLVPIEEVQVGDMVMTHLGRFRKVIGTKMNSFNGPIVRIKRRGAADLLLTAHHSVLAVNIPQRSLANTESEPDWIPCCMLSNDNGVFAPPVIAGDVADIDCASILCRYGYTIDDNKVVIKAYDQSIKTKNQYMTTPANKVSIIHRVKPTGIPSILQLDQNIMFLIGLFLADGHADGDSVRFCLDSSNTTLIKKTKEAIESTRFGSIICREKPGAFEIGFCNRAVSILFRELFYTKNKEKRIPPNLLRLRPDLARALLEGHYLGDGYSRTGGWGVLTTSTVLSGNLFVLYLSIGVFPTLRINPPSFGGFIGDRQIIGRKPSCTLLACGPTARQVLDFPSKVQGFGEQGNDQYRATQYGFLSRIRKVTHEHYKGPVYDLEVEEDHTFVCTSTVVHNSQFVADVLKNCGVKTPCVTIPHPVDLEMYTPGEKVIAWNSLNRDRFTALAVFQMTERKNPDALITGWARSSLGKRADCMLLLKTYGASFEDSRMVISAIAKKRASLNIPDLAKNVFPLTDLVEESRMSELYHTADVHICVSRGEGFGLPVQESAACGIPCIYTDATALPEFAVGYPVRWHLDPVNGMPHIPWYAADQDWWSIDVNHFVECLEQAYEDWKNGRLKELGQEARKKVETLHSDEHVGSLFRVRIKALEGTALIR